MIEKMKQVSVVASAAHREILLNALRDLGILHLAEKNPPAPELSERFTGLCRRQQELKNYAGTAEPAGEALSEEAFAQLDRTVQEGMLTVSRQEAARSAARLEAEKLRAWGDFDPEDLKALAAEGLEFTVYRMGRKELETLRQDENLRFIRLAPVEKLETVAVLGRLEPGCGAVEFQLPEKSLSQLEREAEAAEAEIAAARLRLTEAAVHLKDYDAAILELQDRMNYSSVSRTAGEEEGLLWLTGYIPASEEERFLAAAKERQWAYALDDVEADDEKVPTKVRYNKVTALIAPVFDILGTVPGYREYDISFWFLCFFTLFFAMIIGDAGYGVIFLIAAVVLHLKNKKLSSVNLLLYVLSAATIVWGALTGTWFGLEGAMKVPFLKSLVIPGFANYPEYFGVETTRAQNNVMKFCFSIGVTQLALACVMNVKRKLGTRDLSLLADLGWLSSICALYFMVLFLVIGQEVNVGLVAVFVAAGFLLVVLFGGMSPDKSFGQGLKAGVGDAFTVFLNTISAFGNVMSYIRLFAVGMASLAIAQSFNDMAANFDGPLVVIGALIMLIGHVLNIVMGALSVVVHGVRLNLLEFSGQLGMEWSGTAYDPFRKQNKSKQ